MSGRNNGIDALKLLYSIVVVLYHYSAPDHAYIPGGTYAVEFFLIVSGAFFFMKYSGEAPERETRPAPLSPEKFFIGRFLRFFPWTFTAFLITAFVSRTILSPVKNFDQLFQYFSRDIWEILLVLLNGINGERSPLNYPSWTLCAILIVQFCMYLFLYLDREKFLRVILPVTLLTVTGWYVLEPKGAYAEWNGFFTMGFLRAWFEMGAGYYCARAARYLRKLRLTVSGEAALTALELFAQAGALYIVFWERNKYNLLSVLLFCAISTAIELSGHSLFCKFLNRFRFLSVLNYLSLSIYLTHASVVRLFHRWFPFPAPDGKNADPNRIWLCLLVVLALASLHYIATKYLIVITRRLLSGLRKRVTRKDAA